MKHIVKISHVYQDPSNPDIQTVEIDCDYSINYAFFKALVDSGKDFTITIKKMDEEEG